MGPLSGAYESPAYALMLYGTKNANGLQFINSKGFKASSEDVFKSLANVFSKPGIAKEYQANVNKWVGKALDMKMSIPPENAKFNAIVDLIMDHREDFPPEEFTIHMTYQSGAWGYTTIPSATSMAGTTFQKWAADNQAAHVEDVAERNAAPDAASAKLDALEQAVKTLVLNGRDAAGGALDGGNAAYAILTRKLYLQAEGRHGAAH